MSRRALLALCAIAAVSAVLAVVDVAFAPHPQVGPRRPFEQHAREHIREVHWERSGETVVIERSGDELRIRTPVSVPARAGALDAFTGALWTTEAMREIPVSQVPSPRTKVKVTSDDGTWSFEVSPIDAGAGVARVLFGARAFAIPAHAGRELTPPLSSLRARRPFADAAVDIDSLAITVSGREATRIVAKPWRVEGPEIGGSLLASPTSAGEMAATLSGISYREFAPLPSGVAKLADVEVTGSYGAIHAVIWQRCAGQGLGLSSELGDGCVAEGTPLRELVDMASDANKLVDRQLVVAGRDGDVEAVTIERGGRRLRLSAAEGWRVNGRELDPERVVALLRGLDELVAGDPVPLPGGGLGLPDTVVRLASRGGSELLLRFYATAKGAYVRRDDEPVLWPVAASFSDRLPTDASALAGP